MTKFKPGDRVKCISVGHNIHIKLGAYYTIEAVSWTTNEVSLKGINNSAFYFAERFELISSAAELKARSKLSDRPIIIE